MSSPKSPAYNCVAHAAGDQAHKWDAAIVPSPGYYWPVALAEGEDGDSIEALRAAFEAIGYEVSQHGAQPEEGYEKVALYADGDGGWTHAAKLESNGEWSSKLGAEEDICHRTPHAVAGPLYGTVTYYLRRPLSAPPPPGPPPVVKRPTPRGRKGRRSKK